MIQAILNKSQKQHSMKQQLYGHLPPISKTVHVRRTRYVGHCWRSEDKPIKDILLWTQRHGCACVGWPARTYLHQLCVDTGSSLEDLPGMTDDRDRWRERQGNVCYQCDLIMMNSNYSSMYTFMLFFTFLYS